MNAIVRLGLVLLLITLAVHSTYAATEEDCEPFYEEFTDNAECDYNCQGVCSPVKDICLCRIGYLRDLPTGKCIPEDQCTPAVESMKLTCLGA